jgi:hypothetical protein
LSFFEGLGPQPIENTRAASRFGSAGPGAGKKAAGGWQQFVLVGRLASLGDGALRHGGGGAGETPAVDCGARHPQQVALRCRIVLAAAAGESDVTIAKQLSVDRNTVILW